MDFEPTAEKLIPDLVAREELVVLARALWREGYNDHLAGHITVATWATAPCCATRGCSPGPSCARRRCCASTSRGGWSRATGRCPSGIPLHLELHKLRADVTWAVHNHPLYGTVWADMGEIPPILDQSSALGGGGLALVNEYTGPVNDPASARRAVEADGRRRPRRCWPATASSSWADRPGPCTSGRWPSNSGASAPGRCGPPGAGADSPLPEAFLDCHGGQRRRGLHRLLGGGRAGRAAGRPPSARLRPPEEPQRGTDGSVAERAS